jgi:SAM-dependent methyltransferase
LGTVESLPVDNSSADVALCNQVLEHVRDPRAVLAELCRVLRPGGLLLGSVPHVSPVHLEPIDYYRYTDLGLRHLLAEAGFEQISVEGNTGAFGTAAFTVGMDLVLSTRSDDRQQAYLRTKALYLSPFIGLMNLTALCLDTLLGNRGRSPANLCWKAIKAA